MPPGGNHARPQEAAPTIAGINRRAVLLGGAAAVALGSGYLGVAKVEHLPPFEINGSPENPIEKMLNEVGEALIARGEENHGGLRYFSEVQQHYQVDRDVGASSVIAGLLSIYNKTKNEKNLETAEKIATWLINVSEPEPGQPRVFHDYYDDSGPSNDIYTSFDDGQLGIGDAFWQLYEATKDREGSSAEEYRSIAEGTVSWTFENAINVGTEAEPMYKWNWDLGDGSKGYNIGMGMGIAGITHTFGLYYQRFVEAGNTEMADKCKSYIEGAVRYLASERKLLYGQVKVDIALPETAVEANQSGNTAIDPGYLSGVSGDAFMYMELFSIFGDEEYLKTANDLYKWLTIKGRPNQGYGGGDLIQFGPDVVTWKQTVDAQGGNSNDYPTGIEEGNAGIGWSFLQAYRKTGNHEFLEMAKKSANWLIQVGKRSNPLGLSWKQSLDNGRQFYSKNLDNGAAGIGMFLRDLYLETGEQTYQDGAMGAYNWLVATVVRDNQGRVIGWHDNSGSNGNGRYDKNADYFADPSWHWGLAGIIEFIQRMDGGLSDVPGEQPALTPGAKPAAA